MLRRINFKHGGATIQAAELQNIYDHIIDELREDAAELGLKSLGKRRREEHEFFLRVYERGVRRVFRDIEVYIESRPRNTNRK